MRCASPTLLTQRSKMAARFTEAELTDLVIGKVQANLAVGTGNLQQKMHLVSCAW